MELYGGTLEYICAVIASSYRRTDDWSEEPQWWWVSALCQRVSVTQLGFTFVAYVRRIHVHRHMAYVG